MQLRNRFYLSDIAEPKAKEIIAKQNARTAWFKPLWILPRSWCVTTSLPAKGVPSHKTQAFVQLHLHRLAPFADSGVYACRSGDWVHLWFWENRKVREICEKHGLDINHMQFAPESVCFPKRKDGAVLIQCQQGVEAQLWHQGLLVDSAWWPERVSNDEWQAWRPGSAAMTGALAQIASWPEQVPAHVQLSESSLKDPVYRLAEPWARNLLGVQWWHALKNFRGDVLAVIAVVILASYGAYLGAQWWSIDSQLTSTDQEIESLSAKVEPINTARSQAMALQQWTTKLAALRSRDEVRELLKNLRPLLQKEDAALREFEYQDGEVRLMLVPVNTELNIVGVTQDLESMKLLSNIRLLPDSDARLMKVSAKMAPKIVKPESIASETPQAKTMATPAAPKSTEQKKTEQMDSSVIPRSGRREKGE